MEEWFHGALSGGVITAVLSAIGVAGTWYLKKIREQADIEKESKELDSKLKESNQEIEHDHVTFLIRHLNRTITTLEGRISKLIEAQAALEKEHVQCLRENARLNAEVDVLRKQGIELAERIQKLEELSSKEKERE